MSRIVITIDTLKPEYARALEQLQRDCFPTLGDEELMQEKHFLRQCEIFPAGNFVAIVDRWIVGLGAGFLIDFDFDHPNHAFSDITAGHYYTNHMPDGDWYYGADISVHPDYRRKGIGSSLYAARKDIVRRLNRRGIVAGGLIPDFAHHKHVMTVQEYVDKVVAGELHDSTLSFQLRRGFRVCGLIENYIDDSASDNWATLIVWDNPGYQP
jgi:GNAT superfamily N-acetyltransferase